MTQNETTVEHPLTLTQEDFQRFAELSGDHNPIHVDPDYAAGTRFGATVSHGMLLFTALRGLIQRTWPGSRLDIQDLKFPAPAYADEALTLALIPQGAPGRDGRLRLTTRVVKANGDPCLQGECRLTLAGTAAMEASA